MTKFIFFIFLLSFQSFCFAQSNAVEKSYMSFISPQVVGRPLTLAEINLIEQRGRAAFEPILDGWLSSSNFISSSQKFIEILLSTSGSQGEFNYDLPGNLARDIARRQRPYRDLITANSCVNAQGGQINCDSGAPYNAGVLTTRAYLKVTKGAYNISRAGKMITKFLCATYPLPQIEEPPLSQTELVPEFATTAGSVTFGNGNNCYSCHSQFGKHTQLFVKFDLDGNFRAAATGLQQEGATDGFSNNNLLTSHLRDPSRASEENSNILGRSVSNLSEAASVIASNQRFLPCAVQNLMRHYLRLSDQNMASIKPDLYQNISVQAQGFRSNPSFSHLLKAIVLNQYVYESFQRSGARP